MLNQVISSGKVTPAKLARKLGSAVFVGDVIGQLVFLKED
jgi:hypothetical protein